MTTKGKPKSKPRRRSQHDVDSAAGDSIVEKTKRVICPFTQQARDNAATRKYRECSDIKTVLIRFQ